MPYFENCELLNSNPVLLARHFQYRVESFFKDIVLNGPLGKILCYVIRVEFQTRGSPHVHCLLWAKGMSTLSNETLHQYEKFVDSIVSANIPEEISELGNLIKKFQVHHHSKTCIENILESLDITLIDYEDALSISTDENDYQIHFKRNPSSCFVNNYFDEGFSSSLHL